MLVIGLLCVVLCILCVIKVNETDHVGYFAGAFVTGLAALILVASTLINASQRADTRACQWFLSHQAKSARDTLLIVQNNGRCAHIKDGIIIDLLNRRLP